MSKKCLLPAKRAFEIRFLPQLCRGKKHFYPSKCAGWRQSRQDVRAAGMFRRKSHFSDFFAGLRLLLLTGVCLFLLCLGSHQPYHYSLLSVESVLGLVEDLVRMLLEYLCSDLFLAVSGQAVHYHSVGLS